MTMILENSEMPRMSPEEEASVILNDVFDGDLDAQQNCLRQLAEANGMEFTAMSAEELNDLIIEKEDDLYALADQ